MVMVQSSVEAQYQLFYCTFPTGMKPGVLLYFTWGMTPGVLLYFTWAWDQVFYCTSPGHEIRCFTVLHRGMRPGVLKHFSSEASHQVFYCALPPAWGVSLYFSLGAVLNRTSPSRLHARDYYTSLPRLHTKWLLHSSKKASHHVFTILLHRGFRPSVYSTLVPRLHTRWLLHSSIGASHRVFTAHLPRGWCQVFIPYLHGVFRPGVYCLYFPQD